MWFNHGFSLLSLFLNVLLDGVMSVAFSLDSQYLVTGSCDTTIKLIDVQNLKVIHTFLEVHSSNIYMYIFIYDMCMCMLWFVHYTII
jgi:WD40 repeat protein